MNVLTCLRQAKRLSACGPVYRPSGAGRHAQADGRQARRYHLNKFPLCKRGKSPLTPLYERGERGGFQKAMKTGT
jgi:hypothetical protein